MKFQRFERSDWLLLLCFWGMSLPFIVPSYQYPLFQTMVGVTVMVIIYSLFAYIMVFGVFYANLSERRFLRLILGMILGLLFFSQVNMAFEFWFLKQKPYFMTINRVLYGLIDMGSECGVLLAMFAMKQSVEANNRFMRAEKEKRERELRLLQAQIDPHFLFNNLNILDVLIEQNPTEARAYLKHLAALYRYLIRHKDEDVVPLSEEWAFAQDYIYLLQQRFGKAYFFEKELKINNLDNYLIPPGALQSVIENAVKHNQGDDRLPVRIRLSAWPDRLEVRNTFRPKPSTGRSEGTGLANLRARYELLGELGLQAGQSEGEFVACLPLIPWSTEATMH